MENIGTPKRHTRYLAERMAEVRETVSGLDSTTVALVKVGALEFLAQLMASQADHTETMLRQCPLWIAERIESMELTERQADALHEAVQKARLNALERERDTDNFTLHPVSTPSVAGASV